MMMTRATCLSLIALALASACTGDDDDDGAADAESSADAADDDDDADDDDGSSDGGADDDGSSDGGADESSTGGNVDALYECEDPMIADARPLVGPGYDPAMGGLVDPQDTYIVATTMIYVRPEKLEEFLAVSQEVSETLDQSAGMVAYGFGQDSQCGFTRTLSVYRSMEEMTAFVASPAHAMAMARADEFAVTGKTTYWELPAAEFPPTWDMAREHLAAVGPYDGY